MAESLGGLWLEGTHEGEGLLTTPHGGVEILIEDGVWLGGIGAVWPPRLHDNLALTVGSWGGWLVQIAPQLYTERVVLTPEHDPEHQDFGWCLPKGGAALLAVALWRPDAHGAPAGFIRRTSRADREPGQRCQVTTGGRW